LLDHAQFPYARLDGASFIAARFHRTSLHAVSAEGTLFQHATGSTLPTDPQRAVADLYDPARVAALA